MSSHWNISLGWTIFSVGVCYFFELVVLQKSVDHANNTSNRHIECEKWTKSFIFLLSTWSYFSASTEYRVCYKTVSWAPRIGDTNSFFFSSQVPAENPFSVYVIASKSSTSLTIFFMKFRAYFMSSGLHFLLSFHPLHFSFPLFHPFLCRIILFAEIIYRFCELLLHFILFASISLLSGRLSTFAAVQPILMPSSHI